MVSTHALLQNDCGFIPPSFCSVLGLAVNLRLELVED